MNKKFSILFVNDILYKNKNCVLAEVCFFVKYLPILSTSATVHNEILINLKKPLIRFLCPAITYYVYSHHIIQFYNR